MLVPTVRRLTVALALVAATMSTRAAAQQVGENAAPPARDEREARALFDAGQVAYSEGRYDRAYEHFRQTYELSPRPELLYNLALAADRARLDDEAIAAYEQFVAEHPDHSHAELARTRLEALRRFQADRTTERVETDATAIPDAHPQTAPEPTDPAPEVTPAVAEDRPSEMTADERPVETTTTGDAGPGPWIVLSAGGVVAVVGAILIGVGATDASSVTNAPDGARWESYRDAYDRADPLVIGGAVALGVGVALAAAGLGWGVAGSGGPERAASIEPSGDGFRVRF